MNWIGFSATSMAWLFGLLVPLVIFYFLKLKRPRIIMPSLALWRQVLSDRRVNTPFQRFKRNLLLLLQLLLLLLLVLAAMQPYFRGRQNRVRRSPVLIDNSASMAALDKRGGRSRLDVAKERVAELIDGLLPDQELCLIAFAGSARKVIGFTDNKRALREALEGIEVEDVPSDTENALRMTQALARTAYFDEVLLLSDGNFPAATETELSFDLNYQRLPAAGPNMGITSLNARRAMGGAWHVFVRVEGTSDGPAPGTVELFRDKETVGVEQVNVTLISAPVSSLSRGLARLTWNIPVISFRTV